MAPEFVEAVFTQLDEMAAAGHIVMVPEAAVKGRRVAMLTVVPKADGRPRLVVDLSDAHGVGGRREEVGMNAGVSTEHMLLPCLSSFGRSGIRGTLGVASERTPLVLMPRDLRDAYKRIWLRREDWPLCLLRFRGRTSMQARLAFGLRSSFRWQSTLANAMAEAFAARCAMLGCAVRPGERRG